MHLAGQGEIETLSGSRQDQRGYAMAGLIVGIAVMAVLMTAAMPVWKQMATREKEEELVFRGEQYAHAIGMFQRKTANSYPPNVDILVQQKMLRKKYKDPITDDDFVPLTQAQQAAAGNQPAGQQGSAQPGRGQQPGQGTAAPGQTPAVGAGIIGVTSKSPNTSIRLYKGRSHYNEWAFIYTAPTQTPGAGATGATGAPGAGGRGQGQPGQNFPGPGGGIPGRGGRGPAGAGRAGAAVLPPGGRGQ